MKNWHWPSSVTGKDFIWKILSFFSGYNYTKVLPSSFQACDIIIFWLKLVFYEYSSYIQVSMRKNYESNIEGLNFKTDQS